jgi:hypothetical protein
MNPMKAKKMLASVVLFLTLTTTLGGHALYERHLSSDVRAAVVAVLSKNASYADDQVYIRTANLAIRTEKDAYVVGLLDQSMTAYVDASERCSEFGYFKGCDAKADADMKEVNRLIPILQAEVNQKP